MDEETTARRTALKKLYEHHAKECLQAAELTDDSRSRERFLKLAHQWTDEAAALIGGIKEAKDLTDRNSLPDAIAGYWSRASGAMGMTKTQAYRQRARKYLEQARQLPPGERQTSLVELAQLWHRVAEEEERGTFAEGAATAVAPKPGRPRHSTNSKSSQKKVEEEK